MNLLLLTHNDFIARDLARIRGRRYHHLKSVNRVGVGDELQCGLMNADMGTGQVIGESPDYFDIRVTLFTPPPPPLPLTLVLALPRPKMVKRIIECVTSLGVKQIYLVNSWRVEKNYWQSPVLDDAMLETYMISGLEQGKDTVVPQIRKKRFFARFVKKELPDIIGGTRALTAHPKTDNPIPNRVAGPVTLAVGPEGGFIDLEVETLEKIGFHTVHAGERIMRVETAVPYLIAALLA